MSETPSTRSFTNLTGDRFVGPPIAVTSGIGSGPTKLAAFDTALGKAGAANFNLIPISSVVPIGSIVTPELGDLPVPEGRVG